MPEKYAVILKKRVTLLSKMAILSSGEHCPAHCTFNELEKRFLGLLMLTQAVCFPGCLLLHVSVLVAQTAWSGRDKIQILCRTRCLLIVINNTQLGILENSVHQLSSTVSLAFLDVFLACSSRTLLKFCKNRSQVYLAVLIRSVTIDFSRNRMLSSVEFCFYSGVWSLKLSTPQNKKVLLKGQVLISQQEVVQN